MALKPLGRVAVVQVQAAPLKVGQRPSAHYDPAGLRRAERLLISPGGVIGLTSGGSPIMDIHHREHPQSRHGREGLNGVCVGFVGHYETLRARFGDHLTNGCAGENIVIETDETIGGAAGHMLTLADLGRRLMFENPDSGARVAFARLTIAAPCVEFGGYAAGQNLPGREMRDVLDFLHHGRRGFYATLDEEKTTTTSAVIQPGDLVFADNGAADEAAATA